MKFLTRFLIAMGIIFTVAACGGRVHIPPARPEVQEVLVPVPVPCEIEQTPATPLPSQTRPVPNDLFEAVKLVLADRSVLLGDNVGLRAANSNPCPKKD